MHEKVTHLRVNLEVVYKERDIDKAYETFLGKFKLLYDRHWLIKQYSNKEKYAVCPWITKGL